MPVRGEGDGAGEGEELDSAERKLLGDSAPNKGTAASPHPSSIFLLHEERERDKKYFGGSKSHLDSPQVRGGKREGGVGGGRRGGGCVCVYGERDLTLPPFFLSEAENEQFALSPPHYCLLCCWVGRGRGRGRHGNKAWGVRVRGSGVRAILSRGGGL